MPRGRPKKSIPLDSYKVSLKNVGRVFKSEGKTLEEALGRIKIAGGAKGMSVLNVEKGDKKKKGIILNGSQTIAFGDFSPTMKTIKLKGIIQRIGL